MRSRNPYNAADDVMQGGADDNTTTAPPSPKSDSASQSERFEQAARELECDDDPERFAERVRKIAKAPPAPKGKAVAKHEPADDKKRRD